MKKNNMIIIVPSYGEEKNITHVINGLKKHVPDADILIIDDGSKDRTRVIAYYYGINTIQHPFNMGYGVTIQTGYKYAVRNDYDILIQFDGDGQHDPVYIKPMIKALNETEADIVIGSRFLKGGGYDAPFLRKLGIKFFSRIASIVTGQKFTDSTSGLQALSKRAFTFYADMANFPYDYPDADTIITLHYAGFKITEIPVRMHDRMEGHSMTSGLKSFIYVTQMLISIFITLMRKKKIATNASYMTF
jgi:glycosyltransferase involved in cell wall biosynthesis